MLSHYLPSTRTSPTASSRLPSLPEQAHPSRRLISAARAAQTDSATHRATVGVSMEVRTYAQLADMCYAEVCLLNAHSAAWSQTHVVFNKHRA